jgi:eukaryotic-like serine/threonine-protein kinase
MTVAELVPDTTRGRLVGGRYRLRCLLGRGGMGRVWRATDELLGRDVALKQVIVTETALVEARALARLDHPGIVRVHDLIEDGGEPWIVLELLTGRTLAAALADGPMPVADVARIALRVLDALQAVHRAGLVHRDVKPANIQLCDDGRVVLTDFGIASVLDDETTMPAGGMAGSPAYLSPERARGDADGPESDLFSLGATLYAAVEGRPPFGTGDPFSTLVAVVQDPPEPFRYAGPLAPILQGLLLKRPADRLTAEQVADQLVADYADVA